MTARRWSLLAVAAVALFLIAGRALAGVYVDYRWYAAMGAAPLWREQVLLSGGLRLASGTAAALFVFANLYAVRHSVVSLVLPRRVGNLEIGQEVPGRYLVWGAAAVAALLGAFLTLPTDSWMSLALARHGVPFGESDPYFEADLGFFVYWLPFEHALYVWTLIALLVVTAVVIFFYALTPSLRWERGTLYLSNYVRRHLVVLGTLMMLALAWSYRLDAFRVMLDGSGAGGAFTFADHRAAIPVNLWLSILTVAAAFVVIFFGWTGQLRVAFIALSALLVIAFGMRQLGPVVARRFADVQDSERREQPYRQLRVDYTRRAYALERVVTGDELAFDTPRSALGAISVWEPLALERALAARRPETVPRATGWDSGAAGLLLLVLDGPGTEGVGLGEAGVPLGQTRRPWHVTRARAAVADARGAPVLLPSSGASDDGEPLPPVLVNDSVPGYAIVIDPTGRVAAPSLGSGLSRLAHAWSLQNFRLLSSEFSQRQTRVFTRRGVRERVRALAPFLPQGTTVFPIVAADSLYWVLDLYAASSFYPLSEHALLGDDEYSYVHHAASAIVNAHTGRVTLLADPAPDPVVRSWMRIFPTLFAPPGTVSPAVAAALPPAVDGVRLQALMLARYGRPGTRPPLGRLPWNEGADSLLRTSSASMFQLPQGVLAWSEPVLDTAERVSGLVVGTGGGAGATHWVPVTRQRLRWSSLLDRCRRAVDSTTTLPRNARLIRGSVRAVPLAGSVALVQPAYAWRADGPPALARVAVARDSAVTTGRTLAEALGVVPPVVGDTGVLGARDFRMLVAELYDEMRNALQRGDWEAFGRAYEALGRLIAGSRR